MKKIYRATQTLFVILLFAIVIVSIYSKAAVYVLGAISIVVSLINIFLDRKLKRDFVRK